MNEQQPRKVAARLTVVFDAEFLPVDGSLGSNLGTSLQVLHLKWKPITRTQYHHQAARTVPHLLPCMVCARLLIQQPPHTVGLVSLLLSAPNRTIALCLQRPFTPLSNTAREIGHDGKLQCSLLFSSSPPSLRFFAESTIIKTLV